MEQPIADLDRVDDPGPPAVREERGRRRDSHVVGRRQLLRPVQEDLAEGQVEVALDHEPDGEAGYRTKPELLDTRDAGQVGVVGQGQPSSNHPVVRLHVVVTAAVHRRQHAYEPPPQEHPRRETGAERLLPRERAVAEVVRDWSHATSAASSPSSRGRRRATCGERTGAVRRWTSVGASAVSQVPKPPAIRYLTHRSPGLGLRHPSRGSRRRRGRSRRWSRGRSRTGGRTPRGRWAPGRCCPSRAVRAWTTCPRGR